MEIREIHLKHFGKFDGQKMSFHPGLNIIYGENETGKSTMCSFLRGMMFGIDKSRGRAAKNDEYHLRQPWENAAYFAGSMRFISGGKTFFLDRSFLASEKRTRLICEDDGEELNPDQGDLDMLLEDISYDTFCNTLYYGNKTGETNAALAEEVHNYMVNASSGNFSQINVTKAIEKIKKERKEIETEKKRMVEEATMAAQELQVRMGYEEQEIQTLYEEEYRWKKELEQFERAGKEEEEHLYDDLLEDDAEGQDRRPWIIGKVVMAILAAAGFGIGLLSTHTEWKIASVVLILLACIGVRFFAVRDQKLKDQKKERALEEKEKRLQSAYQKQKVWETRQQELSLKKQRIYMNLDWIRNSRKEKEGELLELQEQYEEMIQKKKDREELELQIAALNLAEETMQELTAEIYQEYADRLNERVSAILSQITNGKYDRIFVDENLELRIYAGERVLSLEQVSRGTMEQICFALRMAVGEMLNPGDPLPIILDDAFITYDDERLQSTLRWLSACGRQVLLFTCQRRENELLQ